MILVIDFWVLVIGFQFVSPPIFQIKRKFDFHDFLTVDSKLLESLNKINIYEFEVKHLYL